MLHAGDLINRYDRDLEWGEWFYAGNFIHATVPSVMTPGNHEYGPGVVLSPQWRRQFNLPVNGPKGLEETCYVVNYSNLKVISLDAEQIDESPLYLEKQKRWLDSVSQTIQKNGLRSHFIIPFFPPNQIATTRICEIILNHFSINIKLILYCRVMITRMAGVWLTMFQQEKRSKMKRQVPCTLCLSVVRKCTIYQTIHGCKEKPEIHSCFRSSRSMVILCRIKHSPLTENYMMPLI